MGVLSRSSIVGRVVAVLRSPHRESGLEKQPTDRLTLSFDGIEGDCHGGRVRDSDSRMVTQYARGTPVANTRQVSILSAEELDQIAAKLAIPVLPPEWVGANLVTSGIPDLTLLPPSTRLAFASGATLIVDMENAPCRYVGEIIEKHHPGRGAGFVASAKHKRGVVAWVEREGAIAVDDAITLHLPPQRLWQHGRSEVEKGIRPVQVAGPA
jgi:MOSC domain-containing protein YiiM